MKKLNITKEAYNKSRYFKNKYGSLKYVSESGKFYKTSKGKVLKFNEGILDMFKKKSQFKVGDEVELKRPSNRREEGVWTVTNIEADNGEISIKKDNLEMDIKPNMVVPAKSNNESNEVMKNESINQELTVAQQQWFYDMLTDAIEDTKGGISNDRAFQKGSDSDEDIGMYDDNISEMEEYIEFLQDLRDEYCPEM